jgi:hypothetical protein
MAARGVTSRVANAQLKKLSTILFDYQIDVIVALSKRTGIPEARIYRYAIDYFVVKFKKTLQKRKIYIPKELVHLSEKKLRQFAEINV